jgi:hypothetical protein
MATLKGDLRRCLENLPGGLLSHHDVILKLSLVVTKYTQDEQTAINIIERILSQISHRPNQPYEIRNAVRGAYIRHHNPNLPTNPIQITPPDPSLKENNLGEHGLFEKYVLRSDLIPQNAAQAVAKLFSPNESIFIQKAVAERGALMAVSDWINQPNLDDYQFITYNCFPAQATNRSESQVEGRKYLLHETDDPSLSFEQQLGLIKRLETEAELKMIVNSGGKSLHAWFHWTPGNKASFLELSQKLGGDPRFKLMNQLCRLPWGTRKKECEPFPVRQEVIFWKE